MSEGKSNPMRFKKEFIEFLLNSGAYSSNTSANVKPFIKDYNLNLPAGEEKTVDVLGLDINGADSYEVEIGNVMD